MVQLFGDQIRDEGPFHAWLRAASELPRTVASERLRRNRTMAHSIPLAPSPASRVLGLLGVAGGAFLLLAFVGVTVSPDLFNLRLVLFNVGAIAVVAAVHQRQSSSGLALAVAGAVPAIASNLAYLVLIIRAVAEPGEIGAGDYQPVGMYIVVGAAMWLSNAFFGLITFKLGVFSRLSSIALVISSILALLGMSYFGLQQPGTISEQVIQIGIAVHGLAWILLGLEVSFKRRVSA
ncbi:MAG TPA: hypothetical protein VMZ66_02960 [Aeromicrobium sp.]|nr:hypothetical protein [Aeromicrobium sp.]